MTALALCAFAANSLLCRAALGAQRIDAASFTTLRLVSGALVLAVLARGIGPAAPSARPWPAAAALFGYAIAFSLAYTRIGAAVGALALFGAVQATMIGWSVARGAAPSPREWAGMALALAGLIGLVLPGLSAPDPAGLALMVGAGACWGAYSLMGRGAGPALRANAASFARTVPLTVAASLLALAWSPPRISAGGAALAISSGAVASGLGYAAWFAALRGLKATQAALVQLSVPPLAAAGAVLLLGEAASLRLIACGLLILGGIALALFRR